MASNCLTFLVISNLLMIFLLCAGAESNGYGIEPLISVDDIIGSIQEGDLPEVECSKDEDCLFLFPGIMEAYQMSSKIAHKPICQENKYNESEKICSCGEYCLSKTLNSDTDKDIFYCGECGSVGSTCVGNQTCIHKLGECRDGYCECISNGVFKDLFFCVIPYQGYEIALQMALAACVVIVICLIIASVYNYVWIRRNRRTTSRIMRLFRRDSGVSQAPPNDTPPKYEDVVESLPTYQDALDMIKNTDKDGGEGLENLAYENDGIDNSPPPPYTIESEFRIHASSTRQEQINSSIGKSNTNENLGPNDSEGRKRKLIRADRTVIEEIEMESANRVSGSSGGIAVAVPDNTIPNKNPDVASLGVLLHESVPNANPDQLSTSVRSPGSVPKSNLVPNNSGSVPSNADEIAIAILSNNYKASTPDLNYNKQPSALPYMDLNENYPATNHNETGNLRCSESQKRGSERRKIKVDLNLGDGIEMGITDIRDSQYDTKDRERY